MKTIQGPGVFLARFATGEVPFRTIDDLARRVARKGFKGVPIPTRDERVGDLETASASQA